MALLALIALAATLVAQVSSFAAAPMIWLSEKIEWLMVRSIDPITRWAFASLRLPHFHGKAALVYVLYFILVTKFSDTGAYAVGSLIGRHKMIPRISPGKTWEGFGGAIVVSTVASLVFVHLLGHRMPRMNLIHASVLGVVLSVAAVIGDLIESLFKREAGVKDSGRLFPGIGGILDLLDSLLFNAPIMYLYLRHVLK